MLWIAAQYVWSLRYHFYLSHLIGVRLLRSLLAEGMMSSYVSKRRKVERVGPGGLQQVESSRYEASDPSPKYQNRDAEHKRSIKPSDQAVHVQSKDLIQLQAEDVLNDLTTLRRRRLSAANPFLNQLKADIERIPNSEPLSPIDGERVLWQHYKVTVPFANPRPTDDARYKVAYQKPTRINVVGSFANDTALVRKKAVPVIDLALTMPKLLIQSKDYLDHRYFHKRAFYLASVAVGLKDVKDPLLEMRYDFLNDNSLQPVLIVMPKGTTIPRFAVRILLTTDGEPFPLRKTMPDSHTLRSGHDESTDSWIPRLYNETLRAECNVEYYLKLVHSCSQKVEAFRDASTLFSVWLSQRELGSALSEGGFGAFEASVLMALLLHGGGQKGRPLLSSGYSSLQMVKATMQLLQGRDVSQDFLCIGLSKDQELPRPLRGCPMIWNVESQTNLLYKMTAASYARLRYHAQISIDAFQCVHTDSFRIVFMTPIIEPSQIYDDWMTFLCVENGSSYSSPEGLFREIATAQVLQGKLRTALGQRARMVDVKTPRRKMYALEQAAHDEQFVLCVGLILNPEHFQRTVERGPSAEEREAANSFRQFWGAKAELRRFQDSSILESVIWHDGSQAVHRQVIQYIAESQLKMAVTFKGSEPLGDSRFPDHAVDALQRMNRCWRAFEDLQNTLKDLTSIPLRVRQVLPSRFLPQNTAQDNTTIDVLELLIQFEGSTSWPEDLHGIHMTKTALLSTLADTLVRVDSRMRCQMGIEANPSVLANLSFLEIVRTDMRCRLRLRVHHERERDLLISRSKRSRSAPEHQMMSNALSILTRQTKRSTALVNALRRLSLRMPLLLPSIMLFRKWCSSHLLTSHLSDELMELLVINVFTSPWPFAIPSSTQTALLRVLDFLSRWDWRNGPLLVNLGDSLKESSLSEASYRFEAWRKVDPGLNRMTLFVATDIDADGTSWTHNGPSKMVVSRMMALAKAAIAQYRVTTAVEDIRSLFATGLADFDLVFHLKGKNKTSEKEYRAYKNLSNEYHADKHSPEHNLVKPFIYELVHAYRDVIVFFHDYGNTPFIAGFWNPNLDAKKWRLGTDYSTQPLYSRIQKVGINKDAILNDINRLGFNLIKKVTVKPDNQVVSSEV